MSLSYHTHFICDDRTIYATGANDYGQLGLGHTTSFISSLTVVNINDVKQIAHGWFHTMFLMNDGSVKSVGKNQYGQLALNHDSDRSTVQNTTLFGVKQISCGEQYTIFLLEDGTVKGCGYNASGQLGLGYTNNCIVIKNLPITDVKKIVCGKEHSLFLLEDGTVKGCGLNNVGQLGLGDVNYTSSITVVPVSGVCDITCGKNHTMFLMDDGTAKTCGYNEFGQLGLGNTTNSKTIKDIPVSNLKQIAAGADFTLFLLKDGTVKSTGKNTYGQLGIGNISSQNSLQTALITNVGKIACGGEHSIFLLEDGSVKAVGRNDFGSLGIGNLTNKSTITDIPIVNVKELVDSSTFIVTDNTHEFLIDDDGEIKFYDGVWNSLGNITVTNFEFETYGMTNMSEISANLHLLNNPKILVHGIQVETIPQIKVSVIPKPKLILPAGDIRLISVENIDDISLVGTQSGNGIVRIICSADQGTTWKTWDIVGENWVSIDESDMDQVKENGMSIDVFNNRTSADWNAFVTSSSTLRFAYYLEIDDTSDEANTNTLEAQFDMKGSWEMTMPGEDYSYKYGPDNKLSISLYKNGDFKVNY